ncbi:hypothetical protein [Peptoniphilus raoultii]|uniref:hypothetical protein n=1 Tax=Peptoniphilus raoultii TaxID=1776387 RepID=UPI00143083E9|nr:hypothetical protein [Peptoniphilus raoultii]
MKIFYRNKKLYYKNKKDEKFSKYLDLSEFIIPTIQTILLYVVYFIFVWIIGI